MNKENKNKLICPKCDSTNIIKHGKRGNVQRYRCKKCNYTFNDPLCNNNKYQRNTKRILSLLFNILEHDFFGENDLENALHPTNKYYKYARKVEFNTRYVKDFKNKKNLEIGCYKAKLLICQDDENITFIQIPPYVPPKNKEDGRIITIRDNYNAGHGYSFKASNKPLVKDKHKKHCNN